MVKAGRDGTATLIIKAVIYQKGKQGDKRSRLQASSWERIVMNGVLNCRSNKTISS